MTHRSIISQKDLTALNSRNKLIQHIKNSKLKTGKILRSFEYERQLRLLQAELAKMQRFIIEQKRRVAVIFEGRDAAGKGGAIRRFTEHLNPRYMRVVALARPSEMEQGQWYFRRYVRELPNLGEIVFFDRSWYNRAVVEPAMGFCSREEYDRFMVQVPEFEHMITEDGVEIIKFWFTISKEEQASRFDSRESNALKKWKLSPVDQVAQKKWDDFTHYKEQMLVHSHTSYSPWILVAANDKKTARLETIRHVLSQVDYPKDQSTYKLINPDPDIISRFHRTHFRLD